jgi:glycosyltransferase involved in cell wall biosynthesis
MRKIILTIGCLNIGGAELRLLQFLRELRLRSVPVQVFVFVVSGQAGVLDEDYRAAGATLIYGRTGPLGLGDLWRLCRRIRPETLHVNAETAGGFYCLAGGLAGVRHRISHLRSSEADVPRALLDKRRWVYELLLSLSSTDIVGVSEASRRHRFVISRKWRVIYNGVDVSGSTSSNAEDLTAYDTNTSNIVMLGRLDKLKNVPRALRIVQELARRQEAKPPKLHLVGPNGNARSQIDVEIQRMGLQGCVVVHGPTRDVGAHLAAADVLFLTSFTEGLPGAVIEGLAIGTPVVASGVGGIPEIAARTHGLTVMSLDAPDASWVDALMAARCASRAEIRQAFARSPFTFERFYTEMVALWGLQTAAESEVTT